MTIGVLLGPQRHAITVTAELERLGIGGRIAVITAGWQEREAEDDELQAALGHRTVNLRLHARCDQAFAGDTALFEAHRARQDRLRQLQDLYRLRLDRALDAVRALLERRGDADLLEPEREEALAAVRALDAWHLQRIRATHAEFEATRPGDSPALARHRAEVAAILGECDAVAIAGGHVATLLNRIRLLAVDAHLGARPILAWSAGAMVMTERIVLFHDRPPEGPGNAEVLDEGLGLFPGVVALPHATRRLRTDDPQRMSMLARRFQPALCIALDPRARAGWDGQLWTGGPETRQVAPDGRLVPMLPTPGLPPASADAPISHADTPTGTPTAPLSTEVAS